MVVAHRERRLLLVAVSIHQRKRRKTRNSWKAPFVPRKDGIVFSKGGGGDDEIVRADAGPA